MTGFMECRDPFPFVRDHTALLLRADAHFYKRFFDIILLDIRTVLSVSYTHLDVYKRQLHNTFLHGRRKAALLCLFCDTHMFRSHHRMKPLT